MRLRSVRLGLFVLFAVAVAAATYQAILIDQQMETERADLRAFETEAQAVGVTLAELQSAQQAYVAVGQNEAFWFGRANALLAELAGRLDRLAESARGPALQLIADTSATIDNFSRMDARARDLVRTDQRLLASDLIFAEGLELLTSAASKVEEAVTFQRTEVRQTLAQSRQSVLWVIVAALAVSMFVVLLLLPRVATAPAARERLDAPPAWPDAEEEAPGGIGGLSLRAADDDAGSAPGPAPSWPAAETAVNLQQAAALCTDLGRITALSELSGLLERAARLLDASGVVIWLGDTPTQALRPAIAHGYTPQVLKQMGTLPRDGDSATVEAYRSGRLQTVRGNAALGGAIVVPLVTAAGCIGVMAAEIRNGRENNPAVQALAGILAAQLAASVTVEPGLGGALTTHQASN